MRYIGYEKIVEVVERLCVDSCYELGGDVLDAIKAASKKESSATAIKILEQLIENARIAKENKIPLCQDTGLAVVFVEVGSEVIVKPAKDGSGDTLSDAINQAVAAGYQKGFLRKSVVEEPLNKRRNTDSNTPAIIYVDYVKGDKLKIAFMAKGGGCENKSQFKMFKPTAEKKEIINWIVKVVESAGADACPPFVVGVGIGGTFEYSCLLSKKALLRKLDKKNSDLFYAEMEKEILTQINKSGVGPQGFGGDTTALACLIEVSACHIASLPVAVNIECHSHRHKEAVI